MTTGSLDDRPPRLDDPDRSWQLTRIAVFALIAVAAVGWLVVNQRRVAALRSLTKTGRMATGHVLAMDSQRGDRVLTISYAFQVNGVAYRIEGRKVGDFEGLGLKGMITVWYDPADPMNCVTHNEVTHARFGWTPWLFAGLVVVMMGLASAQAWKAVQPSRDSEAGE